MANNNLEMGVVSALNGEVFARAADGTMRRLAVGDPLFEGDVIVTANASSVEVSPLNGPIFKVDEQQAVAVDTQSAPTESMSAGSPEAALATLTVDVAPALDLDALLEDEAVAAGLAGGESGGGHNFVDLARIVEGVSPVGYDFPVNPTGDPPANPGNQ